MLMMALSPVGGAEVMSKKQTVYLGATARARVDSRLIAIVAFLAILAAEAALIRLVGPMGPPTLDQGAVLVGP